MKLRKNNCVVLIQKFSDKTISVIGVFKNEKQANKYFSWLGAKKGLYSVYHTSFYKYESEVKEND